MLLQYKYFSYAKQSPFLFVFNANTTQLWGKNGHDKSAPTAACGLLITLLTNWNNVANML